MISLLVSDIQKISVSAPSILKHLLAKSDFQSQLSTSKTIQVFLISLLFFHLKCFLLFAFLITSIIVSLHFLKWCPIDTCPWNSTTIIIVYAVVFIDNFDSNPSYFLNRSIVCRWKHKWNNIAWIGCRKQSKSYQISSWKGWNEEPYCW